MFKCFIYCQENSREIIYAGVVLTNELRHERFIIRLDSNLSVQQKRLATVLMPY